MKTTETKLTATQAAKVASMAWSGLMNLAEIGPHGMPYKLREALKAEKREGLPLNLAKAMLVEAAISGATHPNRNLADLHGIRIAHVEVMMIGARLASIKNEALGYDAVVALGAELSEAGAVLQAAWAATNG